MKRIIEFVKCLVFGFVNVGIACLIMLVIIRFNNPSALGFSSLIEALCRIASGRADLHYVGAISVSAVILFLVLGVGGLLSAISTLFPVKEARHR